MFHVESFLFAGVAMSATPKIGELLPRLAHLTLPGEVWIKLADLAAELGGNCTADSVASAMIIHALRDPHTIAALADTAVRRRLSRS